jgi:hypothetical protein
VTATTRVAPAIAGRYGRNDGSRKSPTALPRVTTTTAAVMNTAVAATLTIDITRPVAITSRASLREPRPIARAT